MLIKNLKRVGHFAKCKLKKSLIAKFSRTTLVSMLERKKKTEGESGQKSEQKRSNYCSDIFTFDA